MIYKIEDILEMWNKDCIIDDHNLDTATIDCAKMHGKYLEIYTNTKLLKKKLASDMQNLLKDKWLWYNGKMSKAEMNERGWSYDPLNGLKVMKGDMDHFYNTDKDIQKLQAKIDYNNTVLETVEEIMNNIRWRHTNIKNIIEWKRFTTGA